jgi:sec-independent protein translocase protein TatA
MDGLFQPTHLLLIFLIVVILFGGKKLPELGKGLGEAIRGFRSAMNEKDAPQGSDPNQSKLPPAPPTTH